MASAGILEGSGKTEAVAKRLIAERRWRLAMHSHSHPSSIMRDVLACLQHNQVSWKKQAPYNLKCRKAIGAGGTNPSCAFLVCGAKLAAPDKFMDISRVCITAGLAYTCLPVQVLHLDTSQTPKHSKAQVVACAHLPFIFSKLQGCLVCPPRSYFCIQEYA